MLIVDAHLDLAMNALEWNRDLSRPIDEIRAREQRLADKPDRGRGTVSFQEMRRGGVGLCVATQIARYVAPGNPLNGWHSQDQAWALTQGQLAWYRAMEERGELVQIRRPRRARRARAALGGRRRRIPADRLRPQPRGGRLDRDAGPPRTRLRQRAARRRAGALRTRRLRAGHERVRRPRTARSRSAARDGAPQHRPRRHPPLRRQLPRRARSLPRPGLGQPLELPRHRRSQPAVLRRSPPRADWPRRGHRRRVRRLDDRAGMDARHVDARARLASRSRRSSTTSTTSARSPATPGIA